jgi:uncharacterized membrane protein
MDWFSLLVVAVITGIPWIELRGAIPYGVIVKGLNPLVVFLVSTGVNILIIYPAFWFLDYFFKYMERVPFLDHIIKKTHRKSKPYVERYGWIGLALFVGVPLPGTGAYSGSLAAHILGMKNKRAFLAIAAGVTLAGFVITLASTVFHGSLGFLLNPPEF